jgi:hypothetical protein
MSTSSPQEDGGLPFTKNILEVVETAHYVEELLEAEHQWIANRLSWLFTSQSFLVVAFVMFITRGERPVGQWMSITLNWGVPLVGLITCVFVSFKHHCRTARGEEACQRPRHYSGIALPVGLANIGDIGSKFLGNAKAIA